MRTEESRFPRAAKLLAARIASMHLVIIAFCKTLIGRGRSGVNAAWCRIAQSNVAPYRTPALVDAATFAAALEAHLPVLVLFGAVWSPLANAALPVLSKPALSNGKRCRIVIVDIDATPHLARQYGIKSVPTFIVFRNGRRTSQYEGVASAAVLLRMIGG